MKAATRKTATQKPVFSVLRQVSVRELGRPRFRHRNPIVEGKLYVFRQPVQDIYLVAPNTATTSQRLFTIPQGGSYPFPGGTAYFKTEWDTWMTQQSLFPQPEKFFIRAVLGFLYSATLKNDAERFVNETFITLLISKRPFLQMPLHMLPGGGSLMGASSGILSNGWPVISPTFECYGDNGETIEQGQSVQVVVDPTQAHNANADTMPLTPATTANGGIGINFKIFLDGLLFRELL